MDARPEIRNHTERERSRAQRTRGIAPPHRDERCGCGSLVAKISDDGVEILCRRCKRIHQIPWLERRDAAHVAARLVRR